MAVRKSWFFVLLDFHYSKVSSTIGFIRAYAICKADFTCPDWFSSEAQMLINRILEPNLEKRISISHVLECSWFKKGYKPVKFEDQKVVASSETVLLFSNSSVSFRLSGGKREMRLTLRCSTSEIMQKMEESTKPLGFNVKSLDYMANAQVSKA
ncbi:PREDICTED: CBL-interacting serine/threonine-protein kinase 9-like [Nelumbo nucifera]|uniref:CBL-interacting serine/threonine-protein kinase 9-like n=1 Tax=Nelumbo nucifera TaxID=4432 RepID=A0A1U8Q527_NELNU|nr:PREDICTED: CBL-interacting serine/threonine-protein kinase 9-like [Nelumbo nucifera]